MFVFCQDGSCKIVDVVSGNETSMGMDSFGYDELVWSNDGRFGALITFPETVSIHEQKLNLLMLDCSLEFCHSAFNYQNIT